MNKIALVVGNYTVQPPAGVPSTSTLTNNALPAVITLLFGVGILVAIVFIIYAGLQWITSGGDKQKVADARQKIIYTIVGLLVIALAFLILTFLSNFFGLTLNKTLTVK